MNFVNCLAAIKYDYNVEFPGLGIEGDNAIKISRTAISIGSLSIKWYGIIIALGMLVCFIIGMKTCVKEGLSQDDLLDYLIFAIPSAIIGARLYYVIFNFKEYRGDFLSIFKIWNGGLAIYGGLIGAFIAVYIVSRVKKHKFLMLTDFAAPLLLIGQGIGRWGNFFNQEAYGGFTTLPWGMTSETIAQDETILAQMEELNIQGTPMAHPTFLYESIACLIGCALIFVYRAKFRKEKGECTCLYLVYYGIVRALIEGLRTDSLYIGNTGIRVSQLLSIILAVMGVALFVDLRLKRKKRVQAQVAQSEEPVKSSFSSVVEKIAEMDKEEEEINKINESLKNIQDGETAEQTAEETARQTAEEPIDETAEEPVTEQAGEPIDETAEEPVTEQAGEQTGENTEQ